MTAMLMAPLVGESLTYATTKWPYAKSVARMSVGRILRRRVRLLKLKLEQGFFLISSLPVFGSNMLNSMELFHET